VNAATASALRTPDLRQAMRLVAGSVSIVASGRSGARRGLTATSIASLSLDPPAVLACLHRSSATFSTLQRERRFSVNFLRADQGHIASRFSSSRHSGEHRFDAEWLETPDGVPALAGANAVVICDVVHQLPFGTHVAVIGHVTRVLLNGEAECSPLLYFDGAYRTMSPGRGE
jgi:flavin reductase (DIM6/NTAB) family NADH-FMN oxidoreductase RutF